MPIYELRMYRTTADEGRFDMIDRITFGAMDDKEAQKLAPNVEPAAFNNADFVFLWSETGRNLWALKPNDALPDKQTPSPVREPC